jgi:hypothetical protein
MASRSLNLADVPQILIGYVDFGRTLSNAPGRLGVQLRLDHLWSLPPFAAVSAVTLQIERIPATGRAALTAPTFVQRSVLTPAGGRAQIDLPPLRVGEVFRITVAGGSFSDDPVRQGVTSIRAAHVDELRVRIDAQRARWNLPPYPWSDAFLAAGATPVRARHLVELREGLSQAYATASRPAPSWTDDVIEPGRTTIKGAHIDELRAALLALEGP